MLAYLRFLVGFIPFLTKQSASFQHTKISLYQAPRTFHLFDNNQNVIDDPKNKTESSFLSSSSNMSPEKIYLSNKWVKQQFASIFNSTVNKPAQASVSSFIKDELKHPHDHAEQALLDNIRRHFDNQKKIKYLQQYGMRDYARIAERRPPSVNDFIKTSICEEHIEVRHLGSLLQAVRYGKTPLVREILEYNDFTEFYDQQGYSALHLAVKLQHESIVKVLLEAGAYLSSTNKDGYSVLHTAILGNNPKILKMIFLYLEKKPNQHLIHSVTKDGCETPLHCAARVHNIDTIKTLLALGSSVKMKDTQGRIALMTASSHGYFNNVAQLISAGSSLEDQDSNGMTSLLLACQQEIELSPRTIGSYLRDAGCDMRVETMTHFKQELGAKNHLTTVSFLIEKGASLSHVNHDGEQALIIAVKKNNLPLLEFLLKQQVDLAHQDNQGMNALDWSKALNLKEINDLLVSGLQQTPQNKREMFTKFRQYK
jgi:ankyrin repeat protein